MQSELIEAVARAIHDAAVNGKLAFDDLASGWRDLKRDEAQAALSALNDYLKANGLKIVAREPDVSALDAGRDYLADEATGGPYGDAATVWSAMFDAAPDLMGGGDETE